MHVRNALNESVIIKKLFLSFLKPFHDFDQHFQISSTKDMYVLTTYTLKIFTRWSKHYTVMIIKMKFIYTNAPDKAEFSAYGQKFAMSNVYI